MSKQQIEEDLREAIIGAIEEVGLDEFRKTSLFMSNEQPYQTNKKLEILLKEGFIKTYTTWHLDGAYQFEIEMWNGDKHISGVHNINETIQQIRNRLDN